MNKDVRHFLKRLRKLGFEITDGGGHYGVYLDGSRVTSVSRSPSDWRWERAAITDIRHKTGIVVS